RNPGSAFRMRRHHPECDSRCARAHAARAFRGHQRPRHRADRRRSVAEKPRQAHPGGDRPAGFDRRRSAGFGRAAPRDDPQRLPPAAAGLHRLFTNPMFLVPSRHRSLVLLAAVVLSQVLLLALQIKRERQVRLIRVWAVSAITPFQRGGAWVIDHLTGTWSGYIGLRHARRENLELRQEVERLKPRNSQLESRAAESDRLAALLGFREAHPEVPMLAARVIGSSADSTSRTIYINRGEKEGVRKNMGVITPEGVAGKTLEV